MASDLPQESRLPVPESHSEERPSLQRCRHFTPGLRSMPWWEPGDLAAAGVLQDSFQVIRSEFQNLLLCGQLRLHPQSKGGPRKQISDGDWNIFELISGGQLSATSGALAPGTAQVLMSLPEVTTNPHGLAYFSVLNPGVHIAAHCGPVNSRIRIHLGLLAPAGAVMRVGYEERPWAEGACTVFDDSWEHEVLNGSEFLRAVLLVDVWHPDLSAGQIDSIVSSQPLANKARRMERKGWLDEARLNGTFEPPSLRSMVGPEQLARMVASVFKADMTCSHDLAALQVFAAESMESSAVPAASPGGADKADISSEFWTDIASFIREHPSVLSRQDVINIIHLGSVKWRSSADHELLAWQFMEDYPGEALDRFFMTPRQLAGVREVLDWCHAAGKAFVPFSAVAAAAVLAICEMPAP